MKFTLYITILIISTCACSQEKPTAIDFRSISFEKALKIAKKTQKMIFIDCYTSWCGPCKYLSDSVFVKSEVGRYYNENFINLSLDMEKDKDGIAVAEKYDVTVFPTFLFIDSNGEVIHKKVAPGSTVEKIIEVASEASNYSSNYLFLKKRILGGTYSQNELNEYLDTRPSRELKNNLLDHYFDSLSELEMTQEVYWQFVIDYIDNVDCEIFNDLLKHRKRYNDSFGKEHVDRKVILIFRNYLSKFEWDSPEIEQLVEIDQALFNHALLMQKYYLGIEAFERNKNDIKNWNSLLQSAEKYFDQDRIGYGELNWFSWYIYKNYKEVGDLASLNLAIKLIETATIIAPNDPNLFDTYAHILFDTGKKEQAIINEKHAIEIAKSLGMENIDTFIAALDQFRE